MIRPRGTPAFLDVASSHAAKSSGKRTVIVLCIRSDCNASCEEPSVSRVLLACHQIVQPTGATA